jgi:hypothetical protein
MFENNVSRRICESTKGRSEKEMKDIMGCLVLSGYLCRRYDGLDLSLNWKPIITRVLWGCVLEYDLLGDLAEDERKMGVDGGRLNELVNRFQCLTDELGTLKLSVNKFPCLTTLNSQELLIVTQ